MDADLSHDPEKIPEFLNQLKNYKFVIGSRYVVGGNCEMSGFTRKEMFLWGLSAGDSS